jgi:hypothetical protein
MLIIACVCAYTVDSQQTSFTQCLSFPLVIIRAASVWNLTIKWSEIKSYRKTAYMRFVWLYASGKGQSVVTKRDHCCTLLSFENYFKGYWVFIGMGNVSTINWFLNKNCEVNFFKKNSYWIRQVLSLKKNLLVYFSITKINFN